MIHVYVDNILRFNSVIMLIEWYTMLFCSFPYMLLFFSALVYNYKCFHLSGETIKQVRTHGDCIDPVLYCLIFSRKNSLLGDNKWISLILQ